MAPPMRFPEMEDPTLFEELSAVPRGQRVPEGLSNYLGGRPGVTDLGNPDDPTSEAYYRSLVRSQSQRPPSPNLQRVLNRFNDRQFIKRMEAKPWEQGEGVPGVMGNFASAVSDLSRIASPDDDQWETISGDGGEWETIDQGEGIPNSPPVPSGPVGGLDAQGAPWYQRDVQRTEGVQNEGFLQGLSDPLGMGAEIYGAWRQLPTMMTGEAPSTYASARDAREAELQRARGMGGYGAGRFAHNIPLLLSPPASLAGMVGAGATMGALQGAGDAPPGQATRGAATGGAVGAATSLAGGALGKGISALGQRGATMAQGAQGKLVEGLLAGGRPPHTVGPGEVQALLRGAQREGLQRLPVAAAAGAVGGGLLTPKLAPAAAIANIERLAKSSPEVALAWGSLMAKLRVVNPGRLAAWMSILGRAASPEEFMATYEQLQAQDGQEQMQAMP